MTIATPASPYYSPAPDFRARRTTTTSSSATTAISNIPMLLAAMLAVSATGGPTYSFGVYANALKTHLQLTQGQLDTLGAASFAAGLISWVPGLCVDAWGSRRALLLGGSIQSGALVLYWSVAKFGYQYLPTSLCVPILACISVCIFTSNNLVIGGVFKAIVVSCDLGTKGKAVGAGKAYLGLGAGIFSCLFQSWTARTDPLDFLIMSAVLVAGAVCLPTALCMPTKMALEKFGTHDASTNLHYTVLYTGLMLLAVAVVGSSAAFMFRPLPTDPGVLIASSEQEEDAASSSTNVLPAWVRGLTIAALWIGPVVALLCVRKASSDPPPSRLDSTRKLRELRRADVQGLIPPSSLANERSRLIDLPSGNVVDDDTEVEMDTIVETPQPVTDVNLTTILQTVTFWLLLLPSTILVGAGTMLTTNMGQLVEAQGFPSRAAPACLALFSVAQAVARIAAGSVSETALRWKTKAFGIQRGVPRTAFLVLSCAFAMAGHAVLAVADGSRMHFVAGVMLIGVSFGGLWPLMVLIIGDLFGTVNHGANYMFADGFTCAIGTLSIAKYLTQSVYESHIDSGMDSSSNSCYGPECFRLTHISVAGLCLASLFACLLLLYRTRSSYGTLCTI